MSTKSAKKPEHQPRSYMLDAHHRIFFSATLAVITGLALYALPLAARLVLTWDTFALTTVVLAWIVICTQDPYEARRNAKLQDSSATFLFSLVVTAATASLFAVGLLLTTAKKETAHGLAGPIALAVTAVVFSWFLVHTIFTLRYAHLYFAGAHKVERDSVSGGLIFPGKGSPDYLDFAYFSFVIGMTCQVSDVQICSPQVRRLALLHGLISFVFNTAILAMFVNIIASLV